MPVTLPLPRQFGAHMLTTGGLHNAITSGKTYGCDAVQVFTTSPQQWRAREPKDEDIEAFLQAQAETSVPCVATHDSYLINPAAADPAQLEKSRDALVGEMLRSGRLKIPYVVAHQGACSGAPEDEALARLIESIRYIMDNTPADGCKLLLENTAGQGSTLGWRFEQMSEVFEKVDAGDRVQVCLDTCHMFAAGYDIRTPETYAASMETLDRLIGIDRVRLIHANDSQKDLGSRVDRHAHIGQGCIGLSGFELLLRDPRLAGVPCLLETPKENEMDLVNLAALRGAAGVPQPTA